MSHVLAKKTWSTVVAIARDELSSSAGGALAASCRAFRWAAAWAWGPGSRVRPRPSGEATADQWGRGRVRYARWPHAGIQRGPQRRVPRTARGRSAGPATQSELRSSIECATKRAGRQPALRMPCRGAFSQEPGSTWRRSRHNAKASFNLLRYPRAASGNRRGLCPRFSMRRGRHGASYRSRSIRCGHSVHYVLSRGDYRNANQRVRSRTSLCRATLTTQVKWRVSCCLSW